MNRLPSVFPRTIIGHQPTAAEDENNEVSAAAFSSPLLPWRIYQGKVHFDV